MISALQTSQPIAPGRATPQAGTARETPPPLPVRTAGENVRQPFREQRGFGVAGGTLVAAQEEAGKARKPVEESAEPPAGLSSELSEADREKVQELQARDREVRAHEQAHARVGGQHAGSPEYQFERGPDGRSYAVGGSVSISTAPVPGDPDATVRKMEQVKRAALAPSEPSGQDRRVAADAEAKRTDARAELAEIRREEMKAEFEGEENPEKPEGLEASAKPETDAPEPSRESTPLGDQDDPPNAAGLQSSFDDARENGNTPGSTGSSDPSDRDEGAFGSGSQAGGQAVSPFAQQIESFARALDRGIDAISGIAGGISQLDISPATQAEAQTTTRRTGVDIRV